MEMDAVEELMEIRPSVYRATMKLLSLRKLCHLNAVSVPHVTAAFSSAGGARQDGGLNRQEVAWTLSRMFEGVSQEVDGHVTAAEETCDLMFRLYDRNQTGYVAAASLHTALIALCADQLSNKYSALLAVSGRSSWSFSRSSLRRLLHDLSQVPVAVQEEAVFGGVEAAVQEEAVFSGVEAAVKSCFSRVSTPMASKEHVLSWLQSEPRLLLWLPTLHRLTVSQNVRHAVRCHTCKTRPLAGLRFRCMKCVNVHVCLSCFMMRHHTRKHKTHHPVVEFCSQPTWRESLSTLMHSARHNLLPRRHSEREADRRRVVMWAEPAETEDRAPPPSDAPTPLANPAVGPSNDRQVSHDASVQVTSGVDKSKASTLLSEIQNLHRDKWLLEQQMKSWHLTVQSEQGVLEDRCSEMEITMETLRRHNERLQATLTQVLNKMEAQRHGNETGDVVIETDNDDTLHDAQSNTEKEEEEEEDELTTSPTMHMSHDVRWEGEGLCRSIGEQETPEEAGSENGHAHLSPEEDYGMCTVEEDNGMCSLEEDYGMCSPEEDYGMCSLEEQLQETVAMLKTEMETETRTGERKGVELLEAAAQVGGRVQHLVDAVRSHTHTHTHSLTRVIKCFYST